jgi:opacity protein-like surface antigen
MKMRQLFAAVLGTILGATAAHAQTAAGDTGRGYVEAVAQSAFGHVTSQSYGVELGYSIDDNLQIFVEGGRTRDVATEDLGAAAQLIAGALSQTAGGTSFTVREPVTFGAGGARYLFDTGTKVRPYALAGFGIARVERDVTFSVAGADVTSTLSQYGVVLGTDLSGSFTRPMIVLGAGAAYPIWKQLVLDFQLRYGRVFAPDHGINVSRAGLGVGVVF